MSDSAREGLTDKAQKNLTPDSEKSGVDKAKDSASGAYDSVAGTLQPGTSLSKLPFIESEKSTTQKLSDSTSSGSKDAEDTGKTYLQSAQDGASNLANTVSDTLSDVANKISGSGNSK
ncbi:hypothetical protein MMC07_005845 [Pseudocyphellaria aurata]|nr:hypothetical protein [Pseudocyphellaria aurata]